MKEQTKTFLKSLAMYLTLTTLITYININSYIEGRWLLAIGLTPITAILLLVPFLGEKMRQTTEDATYYHREQVAKRNKKIRRWITKLKKG